MRDYQDARARFTVNACILLGCMPSSLVFCAFGLVECLLFVFLFGSLYACVNS